jgi:hypothetical protein
VQTVTVTPEADGFYAFQVSPSVSVQRVTVTALDAPCCRQPSTVVDPVFDGTTTIEFDVDLPGHRLMLSGELAENGSPIDGSAPLLVVSDAGETVWSDVATDVDGAFATSIGLDTPAEEVRIGLGASWFDGDFVFDGPRPLTRGVVTIDDVDRALVTPSIEVVGTLERNDLPVVETIAALVTWTDDDPDVPEALGLPSEWSEWIDVVPNEEGEYSLTASGPHRADRARVELHGIGAPAADRTVEFPELGAATVAATLIVEAQVIEVEVTGTITDLGEPIETVASVGVTAVDGDGGDLGSFPTWIVSDTDGSYLLVAEVPASSAELTLVAVLDELGGGGSGEGEGGGGGDGPIDAGLVFERVIDLDAPQPFVWDIATSGVVITGTVTDAAGADRTWMEVEYTVETRSGGAAGPLRSTSTGAFFTDGDGSYELLVYLPDSADTVVVAPVLAGVEPVVLTDLEPGANERTADLVTDVPRLVSVTGRLTVAGILPLDPDERPSVTVEARRPSVTGVGSVWLDVEDRRPVVQYSGPDGTMSFVVEIPPEATEVDLAVFGPSASSDPFTVVTEPVSGAGTVEILLEVDIPT